MSTLNDQQVLNVEAVSDVIDAIERVAKARAAYLLEKQAAAEELARVQARVEAARARHERALGELRAIQLHVGIEQVAA